MGWLGLGVGGVALGKGWLGRQEMVKGDGTRNGESTNRGRGDWAWKGILKRGAVTGLSLIHI